MNWRGPNEDAIEKAQRAYRAGLISAEHLEHCVSSALRGSDLILDVPLWHEIRSAEDRAGKAAA